MNSNKGLKIAASKESSSAKTLGSQVEASQSELPEQPEDSHTPDSNRARESRLAPSMVDRSNLVQLVPGSGAADFGSCLSSTTCALESSGNPSCSARQGEKLPFSSALRCAFSLKSATAQQTGTQTPWRSDLLLLPCGKAEFQIDLLVLPSRRCLRMT